MIFSLLLLLSALQAVAPQPEASADRRLYIVGPNDVLAISVYDQPQLTGRYEVDADGTFTFPLIGRVTAGGLSLRALEDEIGGRLTRGFLKNPQVSVAIERYRSQQIFVMGEVQRPGPLEFTGSMTLIEALARAGSTTERAGFDVLVVRPRRGGPTPDFAAVARSGESPDAKVIRVDVQMLQGGTLSQNIALQGGDTVFVPRAETAFVSGQVRSPGEYVIRRGMTVRQLLALAGGVTDRGSTRRIQVVRRVDTEETTTAADLTDLVQAGDTVVVRERLF
jgi:polysaccharide export outer membrane protein